jgi:cytochrome c oxidase subunit III
MSSAIDPLDVSALPTHTFGARGLMWWATLGFMVIEGAMFAMLVATWAYLFAREPVWPPPPFEPPALLYGTLNTLLLLASVAPNHAARRAAEALDLRRTVGWLLVGSAVSIAFLALRGFELAYLNVRWDSNAYGSIVWTILGFHTFHLVTDAIETWVITAMLWGAPGARRFVDASEDCRYWDFVVLAWLPLYAIVYLVPRWP